MTKAERAPGDSVIEADVGPVRAILSVAAPGRALAEALRLAAQAPAVRAVALFLPDGGDEAGVAAVSDVLAERGKPCVVGLSGNVTSPILALALTCDDLICSASTAFSTGEVRQGLLPLYGATQALPRRVGASAALRLLLTGKSIDAAEAVAIGLVDAVIEGDLADAVIARAAELAVAPPAVRDTPGLQDPVAFQAAVTAARAALASEPLPAPMRIVDCVEAALLLPADQGLAFEAAARADLEETDAAAGLAHAARIESLLAREAPGRGALAPHGLAIWGTEGLALALARRALSAGLRVSVCAPDRAALETGFTRLAAALEREVADSRVSPESRDSDWARLAPSLEPLAEDAVMLFPGAETWVARAERLSVAAIDAGAGAEDTLISVAFPVSDAVALGTGRLCELRVPESRRRQAASAGAVLARLGLCPVETGQGGPVALRLRAALAAAIAEIEGRGQSRQAVATALASFGLIGGRAAPFGTKSDAESRAIVRQCEAALANAGARLVQSGVARSPEVVDALAVAARLYPRWLGGPMLRADRRGLAQLREDLQALSALSPQVWSPAALIDRLVAEGRCFADLRALRRASRP